MKCGVAALKVLSKLADHQHDLPTPDLHLALFTGKSILRKVLKQPETAGTCVRHKEPATKRSEFVAELHLPDMNPGMVPSACPLPPRPSQQQPALHKHMYLHIVHGGVSKVQHQRKALQDAAQASREESGHQSLCQRQQIGRRFLW